MMYKLILLAVVAATLSTGTDALAAADISDGSTTGATLTIANGGTLTMTVTAGSRLCWSAATSGSPTVSCNRPDGTDTDIGKATGCSAAASGTSIDLTWDTTTNTNIGLLECDSSKQAVDSAVQVVLTENACTAKAANDWAPLGCAVAGSATGTTVTALGAQSAVTNYASCAITCPTAGAAFSVNAVENACTAKADAAAWTALGCGVTTAAATKVSTLGTITAATNYASCAITCPTDGQAFSVTSVPECTAKADAAAWAAVGCVVTTPAAITVGGLGTVTAATNYESCAITCPTAGGAFSVASVPECTAKADAAAWAAVGCVVDGTQNGTTVASLGNVTAATGYTSCAITCPTAGGAFAVDAVAVTTTAAPTSGASTGAIWSAIVTLLALMGVSAIL